MLHIFFYFMNKYFWIILLCFFVFSASTSESKKKDVAIANDYFDQYRKERHLPPGELMVKTALFFLETPYVASTLEINETEQLVINLRELDCMTLVENCLALTRTVRSDTLTFGHFKHELQRIRYRGGRIDGYPSRLHYTSDWIADNVANRILSDKTEEIGGKPLRFNLNFMSTHADSYKALNNNPDDIAVMQQVENAVNRRNYYYIPKNEISGKEKLIQNGDIICFVTSIEGLDISHLGIAYRKNGILTFIHASSQANKVIVNPESIAGYCAKMKRNTGIMVVRIKD